MYGWVTFGMGCAGSGDASPTGHVQAQEVPLLQSLHMESITQRGTEQMRALLTDTCLC